MVFYKDIKNLLSQAILDEVRKNLEEINAEEYSEEDDEKLIDIFSDELGEATPKKQA